MQILVGPIASGKSTFARKRATEGALIINDDALAAILHAGDDTASCSKPRLQGPRPGQQAGEFGTQTTSHSATSRVLVWTQARDGRAYRRCL
jgi:hypothetical protein